MRRLAWYPLVCLALAAAAGCHRGEQASAAAGPREATAPITVQTAPVAERPTPDLLTLTGTLRASSMSEVAADVSGKVVLTTIERGQVVHRGQVLAVVDSRVASLMATAAAANAKVAESQLDQARRDCDRVRHLLETGAISQAEFDRQSAMCTTQQWSATAAQAQQQQALKLAGDSNIRAPFDGIIGERYVTIGQYVQPSTRVASVYAPDPLRLELTVAESNVAAIHDDTAVRFTVTAYGEQVFEGRVKYISPNIREASRDLVVEALVPNPDAKLKPGMFAVARIDLGKTVRPVVPRDSVLRQDTGSRVFVVTGGLVQERLVQVGEAAGDAVAILEGVKVGEQVVLKPGPEVRDGARVQ